MVVVMLQLVALMCCLLPDFPSVQDPSIISNPASVQDPSIISNPASVQDPSIISNPASVQDPSIISYSASSPSRCHRGN
jgi:hypothetical protein